MIAFLAKWVRALRQRIFNTFWYTQSAVVVLVQATPNACLRTLADAAKPSTQRLHLRNLFMDGRRYFLHPAADGFQMHCTSKIWWQRRRRTRVAAVLFGRLSDAGAGITRLHMRARMTPIYLVDVFILPAWMGVLLFFGPISDLAAVITTITLLVLSWLWHRYTTLLQAADMIYFVQVALDDLAPAEIPVLAETTQNVIYSDFQAQWEKFYEQHKTDNEA